MYPIKKIKTILIIISVPLVFSFARGVRAATYYVCDSAATCNTQSSGWSTGNDVNTCTSKASSCRTIRSGVNKLFPGDTLVVGDGTYTGQNNMLSTSGWNYDIPSGTSNNWITIKGENHLGAIIDGQNIYRPIHLEDERYVTFENFYIRNPEITSGAGGANFFARYCDHLKILNMAAENGHGKFWMARCHHVLIEGCVAWGKGTYYYFFGGEAGNYAASQYNVVRRSVARRDCHRGSQGGNHYSAFVSYWGDNTYFQNNISLDANPADCGDLTVPIQTMSVFYTANGSSNYSAEGNISVNDEGQIGQFESNASPVTLRNNAIWLKRTNDNLGVYTYGPAVAVDNNTFGNVGGTGEYSGQCVRTNGNPILSLKNNIIWGCEKGGLINVNSNNSYNVLYNNGVNYFYSTPGLGERTDIDPFNSGLKYLPETESGSLLKSVGESGGKVGASVVKKVGRPGTLYGEAGWDEVTSEDLWPWENEEKIKQILRTYSGSYVDDNSQFVAVEGQRGFASSGNGLYGGPITLTSYIWEYLGNPCPAEICDYGQEPDDTPPAQPTGLVVN